MANETNFAMLNAMRRRDLLTLGLLAGIIHYSWQQLRPPVVDETKLPVSPALVAGFSPWTGPIERAQAHDQVGDSNGQPQVKGDSTDDSSGDSTPDSSDAPNDTPTADQIFQPPKTLLPVEEYVGQPLVFSLAAMLEQAGVTINPEDIVHAFPDPELGLGSKIQIYRATPVVVTDWGKQSNPIRTWQTTAGDFYQEQGIELGENDRSNLGLDKPLGLNDAGTQAELTITRVAITEVKVKEEISYKVIEKEDPELPRGQKKVTKGKKGERTLTYRDTRENGVRVKHELLKTEVTTQPEDELIIAGTKVLIGEKYTGRASWYNYTSTKVATDHFKRGVELRITNLENGKQIFVKNDGCICADTGYVVDLNPEYFKALGGKISDGVMKRVEIAEILN